MTDTLELPLRLQRLVDSGISGLDIMHGELKNLMLIAEQNFEAAKNGDPLEEDEHDESDDYHNAKLDTLTELYQLTYALSFAIAEAYNRELKRSM
jgi:hypothetical protein